MSNNIQFTSFLDKCAARGLTVRTIEHISENVRRIAIHRSLKVPVIAIVILALDPRDGYSIYFASETNSIDADIDFIQKAKP